MVTRVDEDELADLGYDELLDRHAGAGKEPGQADLEALKFAIAVVTATFGRRTA